MFSQASSQFRIRTKAQPTELTPLSASVELFCVAPELLEKFWPYASPLIRLAVVRSPISDFYEVERGLFLGRHQLWIVWDGVEILAAGITSLERANGRMACTLVALGGRNMKRWIHLYEGIEQFARNEGAQSLVIMGRKGWTRVLKDYRATNVILEKALQ